MTFTVKYQPKYVREVKDIPAGPHFAVFQDESMSYDDGYGRHGESSRSTIHYLNYLAFENIEQVATWVREQDAGHTYGAKREFKVVEVRPCIVQREVRISVTPGSSDS